MNDYEFEKVLSSIKIVYDECDELNITYMLNGKFLWVKNENGIFNAFRNFSLSNLDKLLKTLRNEKIEFHNFEIQN